MLKNSLLLLILLTFILTVGCTGLRAPPPRIVLADLDEERQLTEEEVVENEYIIAEIKLKEEILKKRVEYKLKEETPEKRKEPEPKPKIVSPKETSSQRSWYTEISPEQLQFRSSFRPVKKVVLPKVIANQNKPEPEPVPEPPPEPDADSQPDQNRFCHYNLFNEASKKHTVSSYKNFLSRCNDKTSYWYSAATTHLEELQKEKEPAPKTVLPKVTALSKKLEPVPEQEPKVILPKVTSSSKMPELKVVLPKATAIPKTPEPVSEQEPNVILPKVTSSSKVTKQSEKPKTILIPTGSLGKISDVRKRILERTLESKLDDYFAIVPIELFNEAKEKAFEELDYEECTEDQCIIKIQELLQIENAFKMELFSEGKDTQISITWNDQEQKRVEEDYCEGCKTKELRKMIGGLVDKLVGGL